MKKFVILSVIIAACTSPLHKSQGSTEAGKASLTYEVSVEEKENLEAIKLPKIEVHFSPKGGCTDAITTFIGGTKKELDILAYSFTSLKIISAIGAKSELDAGKRIPVIAILDRSDIGTPVIGQLENENVTVFIDEKHAIMHDKVMIRDETAVETGSFNYTNQAENANAENCLIIRDASTAAAYMANFKVHLSHSLPAAAAVEKWKQRKLAKTASEAD